MIFVDSNIPMYLVGTPDPNKDAAQRLLEGCVSRGEKLVTDAEVLQEIQHRYAAINRREAIPPAFAVLQRVVDLAFPIEPGDVDEAARLLLRLPAPLRTRRAPSRNHASPWSGSDPVV